MSGLGEDLGVEALNDVHPPQDPLHQLRRREDGVGVSPRDGRLPTSPRSAPSSTRPRASPTSTARRTACRRRRPSTRSSGRPAPWQAGHRRLDRPTGTPRPTGRRATSRRSSGRRRTRSPRSRPSSVGTGLVAGIARAGRRGGRPGRRVHLDASSRCSSPRSAARWSARCRSTTWRRPIGPATTLVAFSLVQMQTGKMADLEAIVERQRTPWRAGPRSTPRRPIPFVPLDGRHRPDRLPRLLGLQAPALAARDRLPLRPARPLGRARATERQLARGGPAVRPLLRRAVDAGTRRAPVRRVARPGSRGSAPPNRCACSPSGRRPARSRPCAAWPRAWPAAWACRGTAARSCAPSSTTARRPARRCAAAGVKASVRGTAIRFAVHVYNTEADLDRAAEAIAPFRLTRPPQVLATAGTNSTPAARQSSISS